MMIQMMVGASKGTLLNATMTEGSLPTPEYGFVNGAYGSMTSTNVAGGYTLEAIYDTTTAGRVVISGFSSDPTVSFLSSVKVGNVTKTTGSSFGVYNYTSGTATWVWFSLFGLDGSGTSSVLIL